MKRFLTTVAALAAFALLASETMAQPGGRPGGGGRPGAGQPGRGGRPGGSRFQRPKPGEIMPSFLAQRLNLTEEQKKKFEELQKEVAKKMESILTAEQKKTLKEIEEGAGRFGGGRPGTGGRPEGGRPRPEGARPEGRRPGRPEGGRPARPEGGRPARPEGN